MGELTGKVRSVHLRRAAWVYVRQSSMTQVPITPRALPANTSWPQRDRVIGSPDHRRRVSRRVSDGARSRAASSGAAPG